MPEFCFKKAAEIPDFPSLAEELMKLGWAEFILRDPVAVGAWEDFYRFFGDYGFAVWEMSSDSPAAIGLTAPLAWDEKAETLPEEGWQWVLRQSISDHLAGRKPRTLSAVAAVVHPDFRGHGLAAEIVRRMMWIAVENGFSRVIAPLRPSMKFRYPLTPMENYLRWRTADGAAFDPWLRVHVSLGAEIVGVCRRSIVIEAGVDAWAKWTGLEFPESGEYVIPLGDVPLRVDVSAGRGIYVAPGIWVVHHFS